MGDRRHASIAAILNSYGDPILLAGARIGNRPPAPV